MSPVFEDWKQAWREAVENFRRELADDETGGSTRIRAMQREFGAARRALDKLDDEIRRTRRESEEEREQEQVCRRREDMARRINDEETVRIAVEFAVRHAERAGVLERKVVVLVEERTILARDLDGMKKSLEEEAGPEAAQVSDGAAAGASHERARERLRERERQDRDFSRLEREAKEKAAEARLEELKKRMQ
jgi:hypothetical protein